MKKFKKKLSIVLCAILLMGTTIDPLYVVAEENQDLQENIMAEETTVSHGDSIEAPQHIEKDVIINPIYVDVLDKEEVRAEHQFIEQYGISLLEADSVYDTIEEAAAYVKDCMVLRMNSITVTIPREIYDNNAFGTIWEEAMKYTDSCTGQEGDALRGVWSSQSSCG